MFYLLDREDEAVFGVCGSLLLGWISLLSKSETYFALLYQLRASNGCNAGLV